jgi:hypothetical protein
MQISWGHRSSENAKLKLRKHAKITKFRKISRNAREIFFAGAKFCAQNTKLLRNFHAKFGGVWREI